MKIVILALAAAALMSGAAVSSFAQGAQPSVTNAPSTVFNSSQGFSLSYPSGWMVASKDQTEEVAQSARPYLDKLGQVDLDRLAVMVFDPNSGGFLANLNVVVSPGVLEVSDQHKEDMRSVVLEEGKALGTELSDVRITIESFAGRQAMVARFNLEMNGNQISEMQVAIPGRNQTYIVTCTSARADTAHYEPIFKAMIDSMDIDEGFSGMPAWLRNALIGAGIGLAYGVGKTLLNAAQPSTKSP